MLLDTRATRHKLAKHRDGRGAGGEGRHGHQLICPGGALLLVPALPLLTLVDDVPLPPGGAPHHAILRLAGLQILHLDLLVVHCLVVHLVHDVGITGQLPLLPDSGLRGDLIVNEDHLLHFKIR